MCKVLEGNKAEYGQKVVEELSGELSLNYGKGFEKSSLFRMIKFYNEFSDYEKVVTLSQQLTWSHFVALLPIEEYLTKMPPKDLLEQKLLQAIEKAKEHFDTNNLTR